MPDMQRFREVVDEAGCAIIGQTGNLAPADRRLYAIRDVTATVESVPMITASILSKKLAAGLDGLVMDIKTGNGAFAATMDFARELAHAITGVAAEAGLPATALITDMNQPLASAAGNAVEVQNAIDYLTGRKREERLHRVVTALCAQMLLAGGLAETFDTATARIEAVLAGGAAAEHFQKMVAALGGPSDLVEKAGRHLPAAPVIEPVYPETAGHVIAIDTFAIGNAVVVLGGGRRRARDTVDPAVGLTQLAAIGERIEARQPLAMIHARSAGAAAEAAATIRQSYTLGTADAVRPPALIRERIGKAP
ncbi:MAG TPA: thymidine phosphorylase, partial [Rhodobacteraceae bacterium]|nr:thymidine phosphorylase [Paracoccaceae bacterium]